MTKNGFHYLTAVLLLTAFAFLGNALAGNGYGTYPRAGRVSGIVRDRELTSCYIIDAAGHYWWLDDPEDFEDFEEGDLIAMIINDAGTKEDISDDYIVRAVYAGRI